MNNIKSGVLICCPFFRPNIGGVETHLDDLCEYLRKNGYHVYVVTYQPLTTKARGPDLETKTNLEIRRVRWFGFDLFHKLEPFPAVEFLYITPRLLIAAFMFLIFNTEKIDVIHAHGFNSAFIARTLKPLFKKRVVVSTHAIYNLTKKGLFFKILRWTLNGADKILCLSDPSVNELIKIGINKERVGRYTYWVNQDIFKPSSDRASIKAGLGLSDKFVVLFVGRFLAIKGIDILLEVAEELKEKEIQFLWIGTGPLSEVIRMRCEKNPKMCFIGKVDNQDLPRYYNAGDVLCVPSKYEEGYGRVILEALSCGVPVIASRKGGIREVVNEGVGLLCEPHVEDFKSAILKLYEDQPLRKSMANNAVEYSRKRFSSANAKIICDSYGLKNG